MLRGEDWNPGVIGIVASRILEQYGCPVLLFTKMGDELVGSGRSVPMIDLFGLLSAHGEFFTRFGGHTQAAGAAMKAENFDACRRALLKDLAARFPDGPEREAIEYEDTLSLADCTVDFCRELEMLAPFGEVTIITGIIGLLFKEYVEKIMINPQIICILLFITGLILLTSEKFYKGDKNINLKSAILIAIAQGLAVFPGFSRSGLTISTALFCRV